ncbi:hypothetical protein R6Q57_017501 [Mikania cordata]
MAFQPSYREVVVEFLSIFTYRPSGVPEIVFSMLRQRHEMSLVEFAVLSGIYWESETVTPLYTAGITEIDNPTLRAWWPHIAEDPFVGTKARVSRIRDPLIQYMHQLIVTSIARRGKRREWRTLDQGESESHPRPSHSIYAPADCHVDCWMSQKPRVAHVVGFILFVMPHHRAYIPACTLSFRVLRDVLPPAAAQSHIWQCLYHHYRSSTGSSAPGQSRGAV